MSYEQALQAAGAEILAFEKFGSYQGEWFAKVRINGEVGFINGSYGSCSGCDSFEAEFGYNNAKCEEHRYDYGDEKVECADCKKAETEYAEKLSAFGKNYLDGILTYDAALKQAGANSEWDISASEMVEWVTKHA